MVQFRVRQRPHLVCAAVKYDSEFAEEIRAIQNQTVKSVIARSCVLVFAEYETEYVIRNLYHFFTNFSNRMIEIDSWNTGSRYVFVDMRCWGLCSIVNREARIGAFSHAGRIRRRAGVSRMWRMIVRKGNI